MPRIKKQTFKTRPKGSGTITKLSGKRRKPYAARVTVYDPNSPKQVIKLIGTYETWEEANQALTIYNMVNENKVGRNMINNEMFDKFKSIGKPMPTFEEIFIVVLEQLKVKISDSRLKVYISTFNKHLASIKDRRINTIGLRDMQAIIDNLKSNKYTGKTLNDVKTICMKVFEYAVIHEYIDRNYDFTSYIDVSGSIDKKSGHKVLSSRDIKDILNRNDELSNLLKLGLYTGCRPGELLNMEMSNIYIDVVEDGHTVSYMIGGSKTDAGRNKVIPIHNDVKKDVLKIIEYANSFRNYHDFNYTFEKYKNEFNFNHSYYDIRHTFATLAKESGMSDNARARIMGHKQGNITDDIYTHESIVYLYNELQKLDVKSKI